MITFESSLCECGVLHDGEINYFHDLKLHYKILGEAISLQDLWLAVLGTGLPWKQMEACPVKHPVNTVVFSVWGFKLSSLLLCCLH